MFFLGGKASEHGREREGGRRECVRVCVVAFPVIVTTAMIVFFLFFLYKAYFVIAQSVNIFRNN